MLVSFDWMLEITCPFYCVPIGATKCSLFSTTTIRPEFLTSKLSRGPVRRNVATVFELLGFSLPLHS